MQILNFLLLLRLIASIFSSKIVPYGRKPIILSANNQNKYSTYTFYFYTETDLDEGIFLINLYK